MEELEGLDILEGLELEFCGLEIGWDGEGYRVAGGGVGEGNALGVEHEPGGGCAIQAVADDGAVESPGMRGVDSQLMGAAREQGKGDPCQATTALEHTVTGHGRFTELIIYALARTIVNIGH